MSLTEEASLWTLAIKRCSHVRPTGALELREEATVLLGALSAAEMFFL